VFEKFTGEKVQLTIIDDAGEPSTSTSEDGGLAEMPTTAPGDQTLFQSFHFDSGSVVVSAREEWARSHCVRIIPGSGEFRP
jgi:hypothetical protein